MSNRRFTGMVQPDACGGGATVAQTRHTRLRFGWKAFRLAGRSGSPRCSGVSGAFPPGRAESGFTLARVLLSDLIVKTLLLFPVVLMAWLAAPGEARAGHFFLEASSGVAAPLGDSIYGVGLDNGMAFGVGGGWKRFPLKFFGVFHYRWINQLENRVWLGKNGQVDFEREEHGLRTGLRLIAPFNDVFRMQGEVLFGWAWLQSSGRPSHVPPLLARTDTALWSLLLEPNFRLNPWISVGAALRFDFLSGGGVDLVEFWARRRPGNSDTRLSTLAALTFHF
ncbi:MAG: hypothetical protein GMKNLPBB_02406 [Myxococcota bacterium]|nr:hypothetical protein [Myxococcota bacterium]